MTNKRIKLLLVIGVLFLAVGLSLLASLGVAATGRGIETVEPPHFDMQAGSQLQVNCETEFTGVEFDGDHRLWVGCGGE